MNIPTQQLWPSLCCLSTGEWDWHPQYDIITCAYPCLHVFVYDIVNCSSYVIAVWESYVYNNLYMFNVCLYMFTCDWAIHRHSKMRFEPALRRTLSNNAPGGRERNMRLGCAYFLGFPRGRERNMRAGTSYFRGFLGGVNGTCSQGANSINPIGHLITHFGLDVKQTKN